MARFRIVLQRIWIKPDPDWRGNLPFRVIATVAANGATRTFSDEKAWLEAASGTSYYCCGDAWVTEIDVDPTDDVTLAIRFGGFEGGLGGTLQLAATAPILLRDDHTPFELVVLAERIPDAIPVELEIPRLNEDSGLQPTVQMELKAVIVYKERAFNAQHDRCWIGERVELRVSMPGLTEGAFRWAVHGPVAAGWDEGKLAEEITLDEAVLAVHWLAAGTFRVEVIVTSGSREVRATADMTVLAPTVTITVHQQRVAIYEVDGVVSFGLGIPVSPVHPVSIWEKRTGQDQRTFRLSGVVEGEERDAKARECLGMIFDATVDDGNDGNEGEWCFVQLVRSDHVELIRGTQNERPVLVRRKRVMPWVLDSQFPYQDPASDNADHAQLDTNSNPATVTDTPGCGVPVGDHHRSREDHFAMFVLFRSSADHAIWVPLRVVCWGWCGRVNRGKNGGLTLMGPSWKWRPALLRHLDVGAQYVLETEKTTQLPTWTGVTTDHDDTWGEQEVIKNDL